MLTWKIVILVLGTAALVFISRASLLKPGTHGFYRFFAFEAILVEARDLTSIEAPYELVKTMRASFLTLGPLVARGGHARVSTPGGCAIGSRPVGIHLAGLERMGASIRQSHGYVEAEAARLHGARLVLDFPSVGATENLMMGKLMIDSTVLFSPFTGRPYG